jgi:hypothetical protein
MSSERQHQDPTAHRVQALNPEPRNLQLSREAIVLNVHSATAFQCTFQTTHAILIKRFIIAVTPYPDVTQSVQ